MSKVSEGLISTYAATLGKTSIDIYILRSLKVEGRLSHVLFMGERVNKILNNPSDSSMI